MMLSSGALITLVAPTVSSLSAHRVSRRRAPISGGVFRAMATRRASQALVARLAAFRGSATASRAARARPTPVATIARSVGLGPGRALARARSFSLAAASRHAAFGAADVENAEPTSGDPSSDKVPFSSSPDIHPSVLDALKRLGFEDATHVQHASSGAMASGGDVVIAAETGSGKTLSYLVPIFSNLLRHGHGGEKKGVGCLILVPNASLVEQVARVCESLVDAETGAPLLRVTGLTPDHSLPLRAELVPDVVVATPARAAEDVCSFAEGGWRRGTLSKHVATIRHVVFSEADLVLSGGYLRPVRSIFDVLYREEKLASLGVNPRADDPGADRPTPDAGDDEFTRDWRADRDDETDASSYGKSIVKAQISGKGKGPALGGKGLVGLGAGRDFRRQYVFAAATVMSNGKKTPGAMIKYGFPDARWIQGERLHKSVSTVTQRWIEVTDESRADALGAALGMGAADFAEKKNAYRTMVFVNSAEACDQVAAELRRLGLAAEAFSASCSASERAERLAKFANGELSVLACTDAAARGVDVPDVAHVVQAEFAGNAVEHLHRIGRTARLGASGRVTNLFGPKDFELVEAVRECEARGVAVESAFSRKRSFKKKFKKYGKTRTAPQNQT